MPSRAFLSAPIASFSGVAASSRLHIQYRSDWCGLIGRSSCDRGPTALELQLANSDYSYHLPTGHPFVRHPRLDVGEAAAQPAAQARVMRAGRTRAQALLEQSRQRRSAAGLDKPGQRFDGGNRHAQPAWSAS